MASINHVGCSYLETALHTETWNLIVKNMVRLIEQTKTEFDTIAFSGASGLLVGPTIAGAMGKAMFLVRNDQNNHSRSNVEGNSSIKDYIIIDDLIDTGETIQKIIKTVRIYSSLATCKGIFLYHGHRTNNMESFFEGSKKVAIPVNGIHIKFTGTPNMFSVFMNGKTKNVSGFSKSNPTFFRRVLNYMCA